MVICLVVLPSDSSFLSDFLCAMRYERHEVNCGNKLVCLAINLNSKVEPEPLDDDTEDFLPS